MAYLPRMRPGTRATRVSLQGRISAILQLENGRQLSGRLYQLSVTGGLVEIAMYLDERTKVGLAIPIGGNVIRPNAEMLFPMWSTNGFLQPFRFTRLWAQERQILEEEIRELMGRSVRRSTTAPEGLRRRPFSLESF